MSDPPPTIDGVVDNIKSLKKRREEEAQRQADLALLWSVGDLTYALNEGQRELLQHFRRSESQVYVICCARRWGKTYFGAIAALMEALSAPGRLVALISFTQKEVRDTIKPTIETMLLDCPEHLQPRWVRDDNCYSFPNGSKIRFFGADSDARIQSLRGKGYHLAIVDEAGFIGGSLGLKYIVQDCLMPAFQRTNGRALLISTPSDSPAHPFVSKYMADAEAKGELQIRTVYDASHMTPEKIEAACAEVGGEESSTWQREFLCRSVVDQDLAIIPEFTTHLGRVVVDEIPLLEGSDRYVVGDFGLADMSVIGFWELDWENARLYLVDELAFENDGLHVMAPAIATKEEELWGNERPRARWGDMGELARRDLAVAYSLPFAKVEKTNRDASINAFRKLISDDAVKILDTCTTTIAHLKNGIWLPSRNDFGKSDSMGHFDAVAMCAYAARMIRLRSRPKQEPPDPNKFTPPQPNTGRRGTTATESPNARALRSLPRRRKRGRF